ncbi:hypothetical protein FNV43_RR22822 [Rhamnella rubrinervis]|uniref:DUF4408 domain-containing protein n=1 Tax=Rhamnella rubrinervis TaxID=2594499 RepID=A0A8K0GVH9_9ROSA|nr:hypothetical protein FNV43_RR22822 [Rhamnella rubrinervis]
MDSTFNFYNIKAEKTNAILRYQQRRKIANMLRLVEVVVVLLLVSRFSLQLPHAVKSSGGYFRDLSGVLVSPRFVFVVGNIIVIVLFAKSGQFSGRDSDNNSFSGADDLYEEFLKNSEKINQKVVCRDMVEHQLNKQSTTRVLAHGKRSTSSGSSSSSSSLEIKNYERSKSENLERQKKSHGGLQLRRSETEKFGENIKSSGEKSAKSLHPEDAMTNEEFRNKVEAFIARQQRFRLEEEEEYSGLV